MGPGNRFGHFCSGDPAEHQRRCGGGQRMILVQRSKHAKFTRCNPVEYGMSGGGLEGLDKRLCLIRIVVVIIPA